MPSVLLDRYEILEAIGHGGMGVVYRARDRQLAREIAIKLVADKPNSMLAPRLMREAQALAQLSHPNVVAVYDVGRTPDGDGVFVAMELIAGTAGDAWLHTQRPWREVLRVFRDAARGLAAAHAVGLVHRDFKPGNMIIGDDGRVRVLDFGLARTVTMSTPSDEISIESSSEETADGSGTATEQSLTGPSSRERAPSLLDSPLTQADHLVGTPQYMSPEQLDREACDARSDQFSFCVAFYRALYGERPFGGRTFAELRDNIRANKLRSAPADSGVPGWLREVVVRGLAADPDKRWRSMGELITALERDPDARRRRLVLAGAAGLLIAGASVVTWRSLNDPAEACETDGRELAGAWDATRKDAVRSAFTKTAKPYAADTFAAVSRTLDGYTTRWLAMRSDTCLATRVHGTQSAELLDLRMECLQRRLEDVRALGDVLAVADGDLVSRAVEAAGRLPPLEACADADALRAPVRPPADPKTRARVDTAFRTLATVHALWIAGRYAEAKAQLAPITAEARALGWRPLEGEVMLAEARLAESTGDYTTAAKLYKEAAIAAEAGRDDATAARSRIGLVWVTGERLGRYAEAQELARDAAAKIERLDRPELLQAELDQYVAALFLAQGNYKEAEQRSRRVLEIRQKLLGPDNQAVATALGDLGDVAAQTARYDEAIDLYRRALAVAERAVGPDHPLCATLRINVGTALRAKGSAADALGELQKARTISERALGKTHSQLATIAINIGAIELEQGNDDAAASQFNDASAIWTRALGADHPNVATAQYRLGEVALKRGRTADATAAFQRAFEIWQTKLGAEHPSLGAALSGLGEAALAEKRAGAALIYFERALALVEKALGPTYPELGATWASIAKCELALGRSRRAIAAYERALPLLSAAGNTREADEVTAWLRKNAANR